MAQSLRKPLSQLPRLGSSLPCRHFTQAAPRWGAPRGHASGSNAVTRPQEPGERSMKVLQKEMMMTAGGLPTDIGLLPQTFIPAPTSLSSLFASPRGFLRYQWLKTKNAFVGRALLLYMKWASPQTGKSKWRRSYIINRGKILPMATEFHQRMYRAFAEGDAHDLREMCCDGIYESFYSRLRQRTRGETARWELVRYNGRPKLVSDRAAQFPGTEGSAVRQSVVRIASRQRLTRMVGGAVVDGTGEPKDVVEYLVIQSMLQDWKQTSWRVWGTTNATSLEDVDEWERQTLS